MHIISRYNRGGTATWLNTLIANQREAGNQVFLLSGSVQDSEIEDQGFLKLGGVRLRNLGKKISVFSDLKAIFEIRSLIKELKPEVVNTHTSKAGFIGRIAAFSLLNNRPAIVHTYHGHILYGYYSKLATTIFKTLEKILSKLTDVFIVSGEKVKRELSDENIFGKKPIFLARPGIKAPSSSDKWKKTDHVTVGWLGRLTKIKRPDRVLELAKEFPGINFLIGGEGELESQLKNSAPKNLAFLGWVDSNEFWKLCDIALLTSDNEAQPISIIEAALNRIPSIGEDVGSVSDVIQDGMTGFLVSGFDERKNALAKLINQPSLRLKFGAQAFELASIKFNEKQFGDVHFKAYLKALQK